MMNGFDNTPLSLDVALGNTPWPVVKVEGRVLHSRRNPLDEAKRWAEMTMAERRPADHDIVVLFGGGWGWHIVALREQWKGDLYVHEPIDALRPGAAPSPARPWEPGPAPFFAFDDVPDEFKFSDALRKDVTVHLIGLPVYMRMFSERWEAMQQHVAALVRETSLYHYTAQNRGSEWADHSFSNAPDFISSRGVAELDNIADGLPIFVVSAGPSLDKNVKLLAEARRRGIVVVVNHALKAMAKAGIKPHIVTALEGRNVLGHFDVPSSFYERLILATSTHPDLFTLPARTRWLSHIVEDPVGHRLLDALGDRGLVGAGGSVATMSFALACRMGGDPVVFVGQDLAFTGGRAYAAGASRDDMRVVGDAGDGERAELVRGKDEMDTPEEAKVVSDPITLYECQAWSGGTVMTGQAMAAQRNWLERAIRTIDGERRIVNATEGGSHIVGAEHTSLEEVVAGLPVRDDIEERIDPPTRDLENRHRTLRRFASSRTRELGATMLVLEDGQRQAMAAHRATGDQKERALDRFAQTDRHAAALSKKFPEVDAYLSVHGRAGRVEEERQLELDELSATYGRIKDAAQTVRVRYEELSRRLSTKQPAQKSNFGLEARQAPQSERTAVSDTTKHSALLARGRSVPQAPFREPGSRSYAPAGNQEV